MRAIVRKQTSEPNAALIAKARYYVGASVVEKTLTDYRRYFRNFTAWCDHNARVNLPASAETIELYLADIAEGYRLATLNNVIASIAFAHRAAGESFDRAAFGAVLRGIRRTYGCPSRQAAPITVAELRTIIIAIPNTLYGVRERALLTLGFAGALRPCEIVGLDIGVHGSQSLGFVEIGEGGVRIRLRGPQIDRPEIVKALSRGGNPCPVEALERWLAMARISNGPVFRQLNRASALTDRRVRAHTITRIVKEAVVRSAMRAGLSAEVATARAQRFSGHSLRTGFITSAVLAGASEESIARHVGWTSTGMLDRYRRRGALFKKHPVQQVLNS